MTPRDLRDRLEVLTTELAQAKAALAKATAGREQRLTGLRHQRDALARQYDAHERLLEQKREELAQVSERVRQARRDHPVPQVPPPVDNDGSAELDTGFLYVLFGETPDYARERGWWDRLVARIDLVSRR